MTDRKDGLDALFERHSKMARGSVAKATRMALLIIKDSDGDYALVEADVDGDDVEVLAWMRDAEAADELARVLASLASGNAECMQPSEVEGDCLGEMVGKIRASGKLDM